MTKSIHFISDLHLCEEQPHLLNLFLHYMQTIAPASQTLYILGDLFEVWIGDDYINDFNQPVISELRNYSAHHGKLFIAHGNRDFLLGQKFVESVGAKLIEEPHFIQWQNKSIGLMHGDSLCTDDTEYQTFRKMVRSSEWQNQFLDQTIEQRLGIAQKLRDDSKNAQEQKTNAIMDVNPNSVKNWFTETNCDWLIHGHTHREGSHKITLNNNRNVTRKVLSDWNEQGHYLTLNDTTSESCYFKLK